MIKILYRNLKDKELKIYERQFKVGSWIYAENPTTDEIDILAKDLKLDKGLLTDALDPAPQHEPPREDRPVRIAQEGLDHRGQLAGDHQAALALVGLRAGRMHTAVAKPCAELSHLGLEKSVLPAQGLKLAAHLVVGLLDDFRLARRRRCRLPRYRLHPRHPIRVPPGTAGALLRHQVPFLLLGHRLLDRSAAHLHAPHRGLD
ncbi:hypothetical protein LCGC14_1940480, partial [marine sediment metagenome]